ncbi:hypothetical protein RND81_03G034500 [Saponaria officinalis]|uniref:Myb/SANT-like domain-containing protein n=1 Tax=Saponaria officinalis TaxID=3572 RepID=A0AAW1M549_SAPOF
MGKRKTMDGLTSSSLRWTMRMDKVLINALINEATCGNRVDGHFTSHAYENIIKECTEKLNHPFTKDNLKNRLKTIKSNFNEVFDLFGASGWGWNEETEMFENEDEVWESLLEVKPEAKKWKTTPFHHFDLLVKLFSKDRATGEDAGTTKEKRMQRNSTFSESGDKSESVVDAKMGDLGDSANSKKGKRKVVEDFLREEISTIKQGLDNVAQALREGSLRIYTSHEIFEELSRMEFDQVTHRKAYRFLNAKQGRVRELFGCPLDDCKEYLMEMMTDEGF